MPYLIKEIHEVVENKDGSTVERYIQEWGYTDFEKRELELEDTDTESECDSEDDGNCPLCLADTESECECELSITDANGVEIQSVKV